MNIEQAAISLNLIGLLITLFGGGFWLSYHFGQTLSIMSSIGADLRRLETDLKGHMLKEDQTHNAMWEKLDAHGLQITEHSQKIIAIENRCKDFIRTPTTHG